MPHPTRAREAVQLPVRSLSSSDGAPLSQRLLRLANKLLDARFRGGPDIWQLQKDLLRLQQDVQAEIALEKLRRPRRPDVLDDLRILLRSARRVGDTLAWVLFRSDRGVLYGLAGNSRTAVPPPGGGHDAVLATAEAMNNHGYGFPLLHDITDLLRIGDISFVKFDGQPPLTVEIKSQLGKRTVKEQDGRRLVQYQVQVIHVNRDVSPETVAAQAARRAHHTTQSERQLARMARAHVLGTMPQNVPFELDGSPAVSIAPSGDAGANIATVNRAIWQARRQGMGVASAEGTFVYAAFYDPAGGLEDKTQKLLNEHLAPEQLVAPILDTSGPPNGVIIDTIPPEWTKHIELHLPYLMLPLPRRAIRDFASGRLTLAIIWNPARVAQAVEREGFEVRFAPRSGGQAPAMIVGWKRCARDGTETWVEAHRLDLHLREMVMELRSRMYIVDLLKAMREALPDVANLAPLTHGRTDTILGR